MRSVVSLVGSRYETCYQNLARGDIPGGWVGGVHYRPLCGFVARAGRSMVTHPAKSGLSRELLAQEDAWYVTAFDSDVDPIFHYEAYLR